MRSLTGKRFAATPAVLHDFERIQPAGGYPYIVRRDGARVDGLLLRDIDAGSLARLDEYEDEGRLYRREQVIVTVGQGIHACFTYVGLSFAHKRP